MKDNGLKRTIESILIRWWQVIKDTCHLNTLKVVTQVGIEMLKWIQSEGIFDTGRQFTPDPRKWMNWSVLKAEGSSIKMVEN